ncbi:hypothetical protein SLS58_008263 [Diplodia intermedia]|uniref:Uncharacterized protein n=1 Tax=Diplodia intermedia TaxID=856260 RepID=A0ABR3THY1_9PEZI
MIVDLARIPGLTSLLLPLVPQLDEAARPLTEERIRQAQFRKLIHLKLLHFPRNAWIMPDLITMVPALRDLELEYAWWLLADDGGSPPFLPLSTLLCTGNSSPLMPAPRLGETLERLRVYGTGWDGWEKDLDWAENFFGSLKFLRRLKVLEIPVQAPLDKLLHLLPDSLEELHLASTSGPSNPSEWLAVVSEAMARLAWAGLHSLTKIFLKLNWRDHFPQESRDMLHTTCSDLGIELTIVTDPFAFI